MRLHYTLFVLITISFLLSSCGSNDQKNSQNTNMAKKNDTEAAGEGKAKFSFEEKEKNLGKIQKGETVVKGFIFKNTGGEPLVIEEASASCGCTVPEYSEDPVQPGETGFVDVAYDSDGKSAKEFEQTVTLKANTSQDEHEIAITGQVVNNSKQQQAKQPARSKPGQTIDLGQGGSQTQSSGSQGTDKFGRGPNHPHYQHDHPPQNQQQQKQSNQTQPQGQGQQGGDKEGTDKYGRSPSHQHYQHNHPPQNQQQKQTQQQNQQKQPNNEQGGKDKYGRSPGHPHYQHNHPPQNQQQQGKQKGEIQLKQENVEEGEEDQYGRGPDHEHYRHNHPPQNEDNGGGN